VDVIGEHFVTLINRDQNKLLRYRFRSTIDFTCEATRIMQMCVMRMWILMRFLTLTLTDHPHFYMSDIRIRTPHYTGGPITKW